MANIIDFTHYYGKHKQKNKRVAQNKEFTLRTRINKELYGKIEQKAIDTGKTKSELTRLAWGYYFKKGKEVAWQKEVAEW